MPENELSALRHLIREIALEKSDEEEDKKSLATVLNAIAVKTSFNGKQIFKSNKRRLVLIDKSTRPFQGKKEDDLEKIFTRFIENAGFKVDDILSPGDGKSKKFDTFVIYDPNQKVRQYHHVVFGTAYSIAESVQIISLDQTVKMLTNNKKTTIKVVNDDKLIIVNDMVEIKNKRRKPDVALTLNGVPKLSISLKHLPTGSPTQMQQWGGLSKFRDHHEVTTFIKCVKKTLDDPSNKFNKFYREIKDERLKDEMVWGPIEDRVDVIVAGGLPTLVPSKEHPDAFEIAFVGGVRGNILYRSRGDEVPPDFEPVLFARPSSDRGFNDLPYYRVMAFPLGAAQTSWYHCEIEDDDVNLPEE